MINQPTSPGKTLTALQVLGAEMVAIVGAEPSAPWANATRQVGTLFAALARFSTSWSLSLMDEERITDETRAAWADAVGAPAAEWACTDSGLCCRCEWEGVGEDAPAVKATPLFGGSHVRR